MNAKYYRLALCVLTVLVTLFANASAQPIRRSSLSSELPANTQLNIMRHEDERRWDDQLNALLADNNPKVRKRAALAAGRIGDERAVPVLAEMLLTDRDMDVRQMAAFALGEIESAGGLYALLEVLKKRGSEMADATVRARALSQGGSLAQISSGGRPGVPFVQIASARLM